MIPATVIKELKKLVGEKGVLDQPGDLTLYEYDGGVDKHKPDAVVFPRETAEVVAIVNLARESGIPFVGRGAGTGLSGGVIARRGGIMISFARMNRILEIDLENERITVQTNHVLGLELVLPDGSVVTTGGAEQDLPGYDLVGLMTGSEGTMGLVTKVVLRLMRQPELVKTTLAIFNSAADAGNAVGEITARAITPVAVEMLDGVMLRMVEEATHAGYPLDAAAVLLIELEGIREAVEEQVEQVREACLVCGAREFRIAKSEEERALLWKGRKNAFGAVGRLSPFYYVQDGVVPRTKIAATLEEIGRIGERYGLTISNIFHAGDGNMHPIILFDARKPGELEKAQHAGEDILKYCIAVGGSITGEHGVGMEKMELMTDLFRPDTLDLIGQFKSLFDPTCLLNPDKVLPTGRGCMEIRQKPVTAETML